MPGDPFYLSYEWKQTRLAVLERDEYRCSVPGCDEPASVVDHIKPRKQGGDESADNLRSLCRVHDIQMRENQSGKRNRDGKLPSVCDRNGMPLDPSHPWHRKPSSS
jgi:5-methylcytosine-specific restriction endonuclease McrA